MRIIGPFGPIDFIYLPSFLNKERKNNMSNYNYDPNPDPIRIHPATLLFVILLSIAITVVIMRIFF